ncbi:uncharacterized protein LOC122260500 [Penaeus japonicus]|uniref:uncharacterized protein LOC122260500 n=1 Tax=Penaeus japonicus TaxID=27405 RepID=UPI001C71527C|nr:uncharacterized protein LOC122260500 [Penaeus japonicus]
MNWLVLGVVLGLGCFCQARDEEDGRIVAAFSTKTAFTFTTSTTTVPYTCISGDLPTAVCTKRRLRRTAPIGDLRAGYDMALDSSLDTDEATETDENREARVALTFWSTLSSTFTITSTSTNSATTFSISFYCTITGANYPPACG